MFTDRSMLRFVLAAGCTLGLLACGDTGTASDGDPLDARPAAPGSDAGGTGGAPTSLDAAAAMPDVGAVLDARAPDLGPPPAPLAALPEPAPVEAGRFMTHQACAFCHLGTGGQLRDPDGVDISPVGTFLMGPMAHAARDPYYLATFAAELAAAPAAARETIEAVCTRCHAPAARVERAERREHVQFDALVGGTDTLDHLARDGVTCTACHQIRPDGLGTPPSFTGGYRIGKDRIIYGPYADPLTTPMQVHVNYTPTGGEHMGRSALCGTCHTVITRALDATGAATGPAFPEQVTYLEWRNSDFRTPDEDGPAGEHPLTCQDCHMASIDHDGRPLETPISIRPPGLAPRQPFRRHDILGGNAWLPRLLAASPGQWNAAATPELLLAAAAETEVFARTGAALAIEAATVADGVLTATVRVENLTGHKLPTAYPTRRLFLSWQVLDAEGQALVGAGLPAADGRVPGLDGALAHVDRVVSSEQVPAWGTLIEDVDGHETHRLLAAARYRLDNRLLPAGWRADHPDAAQSAPAGVDDPDFVAGSDRVHWALPVPAGARRLTLALWLQPTSPEVLAALYAARTPAGEALRQAVATTPPMPIRLAEAQVDL